MIRLPRFGSLSPLMRKGWALRLELPRRIGTATISVEMRVSANASQGVARHRADARQAYGTDRGLVCFGNGVDADQILDGFQLHLVCGLTRPRRTFIAESIVLMTHRRKTVWQDEILTKACQNATDRKASRFWLLVYLLDN
jgi:hypothetical protein